MDLLIKGVPDEAVDAVKHMAAVAVERHYLKDVVASETIQAAFETSVDAFLEVNGMDKKFDVEESEEPKI